MPSSRRTSAARGGGSELRGQSPASLGFSSDGGGANAGAETMPGGGFDSAQGPMTGTVGGAVGYHTEGLSTDTQRRLARKERNRIAAQASRDRKKEQLETLEQENTELRRQMATMQRRIEALETLLEEYQQSQSSVGASNSKRKATSQTLLSPDHYRVNNHEDDVLDAESPDYSVGPKTATRPRREHSQTRVRGQGSTPTHVAASSTVLASPAEQTLDSFATAPTSNRTDSPRVKSARTTIANEYPGTSSGYQQVTPLSASDGHAEDEKMDIVDLQTSALQQPSDSGSDSPDAGGLGFAPPKSAGARRESIGFRSAISTLAGMRSLHGRPSAFTKAEKPVRVLETGMVFDSQELLTRFNSAHKWPDCSFIFRLGQRDSIIIKSLRHPFILLALLVLVSSVALSRLAALLRHLVPGHSIFDTISLQKNSSSLKMAMSSSTASSSLRNVVVVGASYVGLGAANELVKLLPKQTHRVILLDKHSHFHHLFAFPRFAIVPEYEHKAFIPLSLPEPHLYYGSTAVESISSDCIKLAKPIELDGQETTEVRYDALVIATGTTLSPPGSIPGQASKKEGVEYLRSIQDELKRANKIVILGGGAVGVQMATDLAVMYPNQKEITVVQSRTLMPRFHSNLHELVMNRFKELGIKTVLGSRAVVPPGGFEGAKRVETLDGRTIEADFVINATGQTPNSGLLKTFAPQAVNDSGYISVKSTFQVDAPGCETVFALGDIADSGAPKAARPGMVQAGIVARNVVSLLGVEANPSTPTDGKPAFEPPTDSIANEPMSATDLNGNPVLLETYRPDPAAIHLTLGFVESVVFRNPSKNAQTGEWQGEPFVWSRDDGKKDMGIEGVWARRAGKQPQSDEGYWE
ncbi:hypothetical protein OIV83_004599 [Microbotryomycetes sp. JL201]|nr:hypothetical protein OIV83_004599 [Microbotryomycetes sp. JL201]